MVGIVRIELTTPCVSSKCSTTELDALKERKKYRSLETIYYMYKLKKIKYKKHTLEMIKVKEIKYKNILIKIII